MKDYTLTQSEREGLHGHANQVSASKLAVYDANVELEKLKEKLAASLRDVDAAQSRFNGALSFLLSVHRFRSGHLAPDFSTLTNIVPEPTAAEPIALVPTTTGLSK
jgi:hypothetical protein